MIEIAIRIYSFESLLLHMNIKMLIVEVDNVLNDPRYILGNKLKGFCFAAYSYRQQAIYRAYLDIEAIGRGMHIYIDIDVPPSSLGISGSIVSF